MLLCPIPKECWRYSRSYYGVWRENSSLYSYLIFYGGGIYSSTGADGLDGLEGLEGLEHGTYRGSALK